MSHTPWANGLSRLLAARRGLKKGDLAEIGGFRPALISSLLNSVAIPEVSSIQKVADALTTYDRKFNPNAPAVDLWEFFVSDEQAAALHQIEVAKAEAVKQANPESVSAKLAEMMESIRELQAQLQPPAPIPSPKSVEKPQTPRRKRA